MAVEVILPKVDEAMRTGIIIKWVKKEKETNICCAIKVHLLAHIFTPRLYA